MSLTIVLSQGNKIPVAAFFEGDIAPRRYWFPTLSSVGRLRSLLRSRKEDICVIKLMGKTPYLTGLMRVKYAAKHLGLSNTNKVLPVVKEAVA